MQLVRFTSLFERRRIIPAMHITPTLVFHTIFEVTIRFLVGGMIAYAAMGLLFAFAFVFAGVQKIDTQAEGASVGFRLLILPGAAAFWPMLMRQWVKQTPPPAEKTPHE